MGTLITKTDSNDAAVPVRSAQSSSKQPKPPPKYGNFSMSKYHKISPSDVDDDDNIQLLFDFLSHFSRKYALVVPSDLMKLCLLFYQSKFEWTIDTNENEEQAVYHSKFEVESKALKLIATASAKFEINEFSEMCMLSISAFDAKYGTKLFCHVRCDELNYEWKHTSYVKTRKGGVSALCAFSSLPRDEVTLDCYFKILPIASRVPSINNASYEWVLDKRIMNDISNGINRRFYSPNILNGWISFSLANDKIYGFEKENKRKLTISVHLFDTTIKATNGQNVMAMHGNIFIMGAHKKQLHRSKFNVAGLGFNKYEQLVRFDTTKDIKIKSILILFDSVLSLV